MTPAKIAQRAVESFRCITEDSDRNSSNGYYGGYLVAVES